MTVDKSVDPFLYKSISCLVCKMLESFPKTKMTQNNLVFVNKLNLFSHRGVEKPENIHFYIFSSKKITQTNYSIIKLVGD